MTISHQRVIIDSGAGMHATSNRSFITNLRPMKNSIPLTGAFGSGVMATRSGEGWVPIGAHTLFVPEILYVPELTDTLLSYVC